MLSAPRDLHTGDLRAALTAGWGITPATIDYRAAGFGSHHWAVTDADGNRWFVTADRATGHLEPAPRTAIALRGAGLEFVVEPIPTSSGTATHAAGKAYPLRLRHLLEQVEAEHVSTAPVRRRANWGGGPGAAVSCGPTGARPAARPARTVPSACSSPVPDRA